MTWSRRVLAAVLGCALALGGLELWLRVVGYAGQHGRVRSVFDARFGTVPRDSWVFDMSIDSSGADLRGQRVPIEKRPGETRVLFLGDSGTEGAFVTLEETFAVRFGSLMQARMPGRDVRVVNAGVAGMTTLDELHFLRQLVPLNPDVVVLGIFLSNDINFNLGHIERSRPQPRALWPRLVDRSAVAHFTHLRLLAWGLRRDRTQQYPFTWIPREMQLVDRYGFHMLSYPAGEVALYMREPSPLVNRAYGVLERALRNFIALGHSHGFRLVVLLIPSPSTVAGTLRLLHYPNVLEDLRGGGIEIDLDQLDVDLPRRRVARICRRLSLLCIDPTERMREIGMDVFFPVDEHPTAVGHLVLAEALATRAQGFID